MRRSGRDKVRINRVYVEHYSLLADMKCLMATVRSVLDRDAADEEDTPP